MSTGSSFFFSSLGGDGGFVNILLELFDRTFKRRINRSLNEVDQLRLIFFGHDDLFAGNRFKQVPGDDIFDGGR